MNRAIFFDRDGVLNIDTINLYKIEDWKWIDGAREAVKLCNDSGYLAIVITNQSGIARGFFTESDVQKLHNFVQDELKKFGAHMDAFYYCPHHPEGNLPQYTKVCDCRKPKPGLILRACKDFDIDPAQSFMIGDKERDVECGENAGCKGVLFDGSNLYDAVSKMING